jgi:hypothetical protein
VQVARQSFQFRSVEIGRDDVAAFACESYRSGAADTGACRGDECNLTL